MYKITNRSTTNISIDGNNLGPGQSTTVVNVSSELHYLKNKNMVAISFVPDPVKPTSFQSIESKKNFSLPKGGKK